MAARSIGFLRGVNVGGGNKLAMADLRQSLDAAGFFGVQTYIQSGNVLWDGAPEDGAAGRLASVLRDRHGLDVPVVVLDAGALRAMRAALPFEGPGDRVAFGFFLEPGDAAQADLGRLLEVAQGGEDAVLHPLGVMLAFPDGQGRSKMAAQLERRLGVSVTVRNLRTVDRMLAMAGA